MRHKADGFLILDLLLVSVIAGFVFAAAMQSYQQVLRAEQQLSRRNNAVFNLYRAKEQLTLDFSSLFIPVVATKTSQDKAELSEVFFELSNQDDSFKSKVFNERMYNLAQVSFCTTNNLNVLSSKRAVRVTYKLVAKKKVTSADEDFYDLVRYQHSVLWHSPEKKALSETNPVVVLENLTEFAISCIKAPEKRDTKDSSVTQQFEWGKKTDEGKKLPLAVLIKGVCLTNQKPYQIDLMIPVLVANQVEFGTTAPKEAKSAAEPEAKPLIDDPAGADKESEADTLGGGFGGFIDDLTKKLENSSNGQLSLGGTV